MQISGALLDGKLRPRTSTAIQITQPNLDPHGDGVA
jgi:hypothetical protein